MFYLTCYTLKFVLKGAMHIPGRNQALMNSYDAQYQGPSNLYFITAYDVFKRYLEDI